MSSGVEENNDKGYCTELIFVVNGRKIKENNINPLTTLADYLRYKLHLTGTKIGCNEGGCGACTVMISERNPANSKIRHYAANACLVPIGTLFGKSIITIEGIGNAIKPHQLQQKLYEYHGTQCGYCSPGFVMSMYSLLQNQQNPSVEQIDEAIQGNLCRCTGYRSILDAFYSFSPETVRKSKPVKIACCTKLGKNVENKCCQIECCKKNVRDCTIEECHKTECREKKTMVRKDNGQNDYNNQETIFPPDLQIKEYEKIGLKLTFENHLWFAPTSIDELVHLKKIYPESLIMAGNTENGINRKFFGLDFPVIINIKQVAELYDHCLDDVKGLKLGSANTLTEARDILIYYCKNLPEEKIRIFTAVLDILKVFASTHIRNVATIAGNLVAATPVSDLNPILITAGSTAVLRSESQGVREVLIDKHFFKGSQKTTIANDEIVEAIWIPYTAKNQLFKAYKHSQRRNDDITIVNGAFSVEFQPLSQQLKDIKITFSGVAEVLKECQSLKQFIGREWDDSLLEEMLEAIGDEFIIAPGSPGGMERYRTALTKSLLLKFFDYARSELKAENSTLRELTEPYQYYSSQTYQYVPDEQPETDSVGKAIAHESGLIQSTGEAKYCDDIDVPNCLHMAFVHSQIACGILKSVDASVAMKMPGVSGYIDFRDISIESTKAPIFQAFTFPAKEIEYFGQPIAAILAEDHEKARCAAIAVQVNCEPKIPILSIKDAISKNSYFKPKPSILHSSMALADKNAVYRQFDWQKCDNVVEGSVITGAQEQFYLETQACIVIPYEDEFFEVIVTTQNPTAVQGDVASVLSIPHHKVKVKVRRLGGAFGGKTFIGSYIAAIAAVAAKKYKRPVKYCAERYDDMVFTGNRHPSLIDYKIGIGNDGKLQSLETKIYLNGGNTADTSLGVIERAMLHTDGAYKWPNLDTYGQVCKTNITSNGAFRGFGVPQASFAVETAFKHAAELLSLDVNKLRRDNLYKEGDSTHFGMVLENYSLIRCWDECIKMSSYEQRLQKITEFNLSNKYVKRGIYVVPSKYILRFGIKDYNQGGAFVNIYKDGSVIISHGGVEMGQGLHTKMIQVASRCLGIDRSKISICSTDTDKVPNTSVTAASSGADINGVAIMNACEKLLRRLKPLREANSQLSWEELVRTAYSEQISLSATGFAKMKADSIDFETGRGGNAFDYFSYGVACTEVEVDCLTGNHCILQTDIVMDVGNSLNPMIDIGQIEGGFMQGYGLFTMEDVKIQPDGTRLTRGPSTYKIPSANDAPKKFNVRLLEDSPNQFAIFSSRGFGETPVFLGASAFFAIREAIRAYRLQNKKDGYLQLDAPATCVRIRMACEDQITDTIKQLPEKKTFTPWTITC